MNKHTTVGAALVVVLTVPMIWAGSALAKSESPCVPHDAVSASLGDWAVSGFTDWQASETQPADPDGQAGEDNPLNLTTLGPVEMQTVVDHAAYDEVVVVTEAWDEKVFDHWQRYSWKGGPHDGNTPPSFPSDHWQANTKSDPHGIGKEGAYYRSSPGGAGKGKGEWFYLEMVTKTVHHDAVTKTVRHDAVAHQEYRWTLHGRTFAPGRDAVKCEQPTPAPEPTPDSEPTPDPEPTPDLEPVPPARHAGPAAAPVVDRQRTAAPVAAHRSGAVPTTIAAGL